MMPNGVAGTIAGLRVLYTINDPTAAAIDYGLNKRGGETQIIVTISVHRKNNRESCVQFLSPHRSSWCSDRQCLL
jgi:hypothetical protein